MFCFIILKFGKQYKSMDNSQNGSNFLQILTKIQQRQGFSKGFNEVSLLFKSFHEYLSQYADSKYESHLEASKEKYYEERIQRIEIIHRIIDIMLEDCHLSEDQKMDCLDESLKIIKSINKISEKNSKGVVKRNNQNERAKIIQRLELNIIQKMTEFILSYTIPTDLTTKKNTIVCLSIVKNLLLNSNVSNQQQRPKGKMKKKESNKLNSSIEYCLLSGKKIEISWLLIFRILQSKIMANDNNRCKDKKARQFISVSDQIENHLSKYIRQILTELNNFNNSNILSNLLKCLVDNVAEMELPIIPIFIHILFQEIISQFKYNYGQSIKNNQHSVFYPRNIYSLENFSTLALLIKNVANQMITFYMEKQVDNHEAVCSYCGFSKQNNYKEKLAYQKIGIRVSDSQNLVMKICKICCKSLGFEPQDEININSFAPLILSRFWNTWNEKNNIKQIKQCLHKVLVYQIEASKTKSNKNQIQISEVIAMNNNEQKTAYSLVQAVYKAFLFNHSKLSLRNMIFEAINIFNVCLNSFDARIRQKTLRVFNQPQIIGFIFNLNKKIPFAYHQDLKALQNKTLAIIQIRCKDKDYTIRIAALQVISYIYSQIQIEPHVSQQFYKTIFQSIAFCNNTEYMTKSIELIQKSIIKSNSKRQKSWICEYIQLIFETFIFSVQCIRNLSDGDELVNLKQKIGKLINKLFKTLYQICYDDYRPVQARFILDQFNKFLFKLKEQPVAHLKDIYDRITIRLMRQTPIDPIAMKSLPYLNIDAIENIVIHSKNYQGQTYYIVKANLINLIHIVFEDAMEIKSIFTNRGIGKTKIRCMFTIKQLQNYLFSSYFISILIQQQDKCAEISSCSYSPLKMVMLNQILSIANFGSIINQNLHLAKRLKKLLKNGNKSLKNEFQLTLSQPLKEELSKLAQTLLGQIKSELGDVQKQSVLLTNILISLNMSFKVIEHINIYKKYVEIFHKNILSYVAKFQQNSQPNIIDSIKRQYGFLSRMLIILTSIATTMERHLQFKSALINLMSISAEEKKQSQQEIWSCISRSQQNVSDNFYSIYNYIVSALQIDLGLAKNQQQIQRYTQKLMSLLNYYWQINPSIILSSSNLLQQISSNTQMHQVKNLYKLFLSLIPCNNLSIISIINNNFCITFQKIFERAQYKRDVQFMEYSYRILQYILKCGMSRLIEFNKYIYVGLLQQSPLINDISAGIIKEIYAKQASQKLLFAKFSDTLRFIYSFFQGEYRTAKQIKFSQRQKQNFRIITQMTKIDGKCFLIKQKRQIRMKSSFVKKIGQMIINNSKNLLFQSPQYLTFLAQLIKCQECFDYCELYEIVFTINKVVNQNYTAIEDLRIELDSDQSQNINQTLDICVAYRELLSCLNYLAGYQQVQQQLKNYDKLFQTSNNPYVALKQDSQLSDYSSNDPIKIFEDIDLYFNIAIGSVYRMQERKEENSNESSSVYESSWSGTVQTKPKGKKGKKKQAGNKNSTKNCKNISYSVQKAKPSFSEDITKQPSFRRRSKRLLGIKQETAH